MSETAVAMSSKFDENGKFIPTQGARIKKISWWHNSIIEWMLANPESKLYECAEFFDVTPGWLSSIISSDIFKEEYKRRLGEHQTMMTEGIAEKIHGAAHITLDLLTERLMEDSGNLTFTQLQNCMDTTLKLAGFGQKQSAPLNVNVNGDGNVTVQQVDATTLAKARENLDRVQEDNKVGESSENKPLPTPEKFHSSGESLESKIGDENTPVYIEGEKA